MNLNKASLIGNLTGDPRVTKLPSGQSVASFGVATNHQWRDYRTKQLKKAAEFHTVVAWGRIADVAAKYLKKGNRVFAEGRMQTRSWQDKNGMKRSRTEIVAEQLIMLGGNKGSTGKSGPDETLVAEEVSPEELPANE